MSKTLKIIKEAFPVILMIGLIPFVMNDYILTLIYIVIICLSLFIKKEHGDVTILVLGFLIMLVSEYFFISTGVETFIRNSLLGIMPLWLPFLWSYGFVTIKRSVKILGY